MLKENRSKEMLSLRVPSSDSVCYNILAVEGRFFRYLFVEMDGG
jgi:hypothetical protein